MKKPAAFLLALTMALSCACAAEDRPSGDTSSESEAVLTGSAPESIAEDTDTQSADEEPSAAEPMIPEDEVMAAVTEVIVAELEALESGDAAAFGELCGAWAVYNEMYGEYADEEKKTEYLEDMFALYLAEVGGMSLSHEVKELETEFSADDKGGRTAVYGISFLLFDEVSGRDRKFKGTAYLADEVWHADFYHVDTDEEAEKYEPIRTANAKAEAAYNAISGYYEDIIYENYDPRTYDDDKIETLESMVGEYDCSDTSAYSGGTGDMMALVAKSGTEQGYLLVAYIKLRGYDTFFVQWRESPDSDAIGQYPEPMSDEDYAYNGKRITWGEFYNP